MARKTLKEQLIDSEIIYAYARCGEKSLYELENFVHEPNQADITGVGERCFEAKMYGAAKILFTKTGNMQKLAQVFVCNKEYTAAYDAAKIADVPKVWKAVCFSCVRAKEFRTAGQCAKNVVIHPDHLEELIQCYEKFGYIDELILVLDQGQTLERTHTGIYTELAVIYAKYHPQKLMDLIRTYPAKLQIPKLIRACEKY